jgi:hypothetical protein
MGAHQKIDRVARRHLRALAPEAPFPSIKRILHFEGGNGPDAIKRKSPAKDEPWHYFQPFDEGDNKLLELINAHYILLIKALKLGDEVRAAFEASWLAHAMVDGLTPAHHYPYEEKLTELRGGEGLDSRTTVKAKLVLPGETRRAQFSNNWKMWGPGGLMTTHGTFEWGVATVILPARFKLALPSKDEIKAFRKDGVVKWYRKAAQDIVQLGLYDEFAKRGWTTKLGRKVRRDLGPRMIKAVTIAWYSALIDAELAPEPA